MTNTKSRPVNERKTALITTYSFETSLAVPAAVTALHRHFSSTGARVAATSPEQLHVDQGSRFVLQTFGIWNSFGRNRLPLRALVTAVATTAGGSVVSVVLSSDEGWSLYGRNPLLNTAYLGQYAKIEAALRPILAPLPS